MSADIAALQQIIGAKYHVNCGPLNS